MHDAASGAELLTLPFSLQGEETEVYCLAFSTDGRKLAMASPAAAPGQGQQVLRMVALETEAPGRLQVAADVQVPTLGHGQIRNIVWALDGTAVALQMAEAGGEDAAAGQHSCWVEVHHFAR